MRRKFAAVCMVMLLVLTSMAMTGCGRNNANEDAAQTPNADENLTNDGAYDGLTDDPNTNANDNLNNEPNDLNDGLADDTDNLGDDIREGAEDVKDGVEDALDGNNERNNQVG